MAPRRPRPSASTSSASRANKRLALIDAAFDAAVSPTHTPDSDARPPPRKKARKAVVLDDEEGEDDEMELVAGDAGASADALRGGFLPEPPAEGFADGGGFLPEDDAGGAGGFLPEDSGADLGGGFLPDPPGDTDMQASSADTGQGGFLLDDFASEGGFLPLPPPPLADSGDPMAVDYSASTSAGGGGYLPEPPAEFSTAGGFLPDPRPTSRASPSFTLPTPPPPASRISLTSIPSALRSLGLHRLGLAGADLMQLFEEVASDDEEVEGGRSVRRERFREACEVLMGDTDEEDGEEGEEYRDEEEEEEEGKSRRRLRRAGEPKASAVADEENDAPKLRRQPARRSTRANPLPEDEDVSAKDFGAALDALPDDSNSSLSEAATDSEDDIGGSAKGKGKSPAKSKGKKSRRGRRGNPDDITAEDVAAAQDTFDLFFEESPQSVLPKRERAIGLMELQWACRVLKEKMTDGDLNEMLEYAARSKGLVDLESFARILVETGL
ncbi:hypothetical protein NBRC10512_000628 [Rhodotorula toruloides]|uniref:RHTO0S01e05534g1_1 n=2 Tax=Rhodotorula toruloides TaxID=5286 RepID=A0A061AEZ4_RHOTO|nr:uncharacterized protein RHTO_01441 [Rhodotorula toruloides NP11]EMS21794.1 hypothetical protein RHTO_01441 [Rhodotorula toruloides NP11]CDR35716.1 RHTO0S01e05534g1_1 [Rhodotorula toruloides]